MRVNLVLSLTLLCAALLQPALARADLPYYFEAEDLSTGEAASLESLSDGKPLVLMSWAENCPHCMRHMPYFAALISELDTERVQVATLAMTGKESSTRHYIDRRGLTYMVLWGPGGVFDTEYEQDGWPTTYVFFAGGELLGTADETGQKFVGEVMSLVEQALDAMPVPAPESPTGPIVGMSPELEPEQQVDELKPQAEPEAEEDPGAPPIPPDRPVWPEPQPAGAE